MRDSDAIETGGKEQRVAAGTNRNVVWSRKKFTSANALMKINAIRMLIEQKQSIRWLDKLNQATAALHDAARCVHIADRESDIYELFCAA